MTQTNLYMDDDNLKLYVDVQPIFLDELENSKNLAVQSALQAAQSEENARGWKNDIADYKTNLELFYAQASDGITNQYNNSASDLTTLKNSALENLQTTKNSVLYSLNNALNSAVNTIRTNGQNYVNLAQYYAEDAQHTVDSRVSKDHLNQSKALETGSVSADEEVISDVARYAHSTFDKSKFNFTSGVETTDNGEFIIDGNAKRCKLENVVPSTAADFEFKTRLTINSVVQNGYILQPYPNTDNVPFTIYINTNLGFALRAWVDVNGTKTSVGFTGNMGTFVAGKTYDFIFERKDGKFTYGYKLADAENYTTGYVTDNYSTYPLWGSNIEYFIGQNVLNISYNVDMKNTSVKANGVYTFVGNKTGLDVIKLDDFTKEGSPTITFDGIARGFSTSNYITKSNALTIGSDGEFHIDFNCNSTSSSDWQYIIDVCETSGNELIVRRVANGNVYYFLVFAGGSVLVNDVLISSNPKVSGYVEYKNGAYTIMLNGETKTIEASKMTATTYDVVLGCRIGNIGGTPTYPLTNGSIDLNGIRLINSLGLAYQPLLRIPYTESSSKFGSKIVNSIYRNRVQDAYEQGYLQRYYTLDEENGNFTLPMGDIYGMIENLRQLIIQRTS